MRAGQGAGLDEAERLADADEGDVVGDEETDDADDGQLRAMRAVWLSMREEEPSAGGMAELLAAARAHAPRPAPVESPWRRAWSAVVGVLASLRRPPVLALATVAVVAGTAALVARHRDLTTELAPPPPSIVAPATRALEQASPSPSPSPSPPPSPPPPPPSPPPPPPPVEAAAPHRNAPRPEPRHLSVTGGAEGDVAPTMAPGAPPPADSRPQIVAPVADPTGSAATVAGCRAAAARGDCAATQRLLVQLKHQDLAQFQEAKRDLAVARCVP